ncbi:Uncharacterised protein [Pragia fontium]|nr:Uncharacterised protein [Pragia fontium]
MTSMKDIIEKAWDVKETINFMRTIPIGKSISLWALADEFITANGGDKDGTVNGEFYALINRMDAGLSWMLAVKEISLTHDDNGLSKLTRLNDSGVLPR